MSMKTQDEARERAATLDAADELAGFRDRFDAPDPGIVYLDGNSLGRPPKATLERLHQVVRGEWADRLIRSWDEKWMTLAASVGDLIGTGLVGARAGEVVVADSTTVNLYKLLGAALDARGGRRTIVTDRDDFPTDRYVVEGLAAARGMDVRWIEADPIEGPQPEHVAAVLDDDVAVVSLSHVSYRSAAMADMQAITSLTHDAGALTLWDLSHAVGAVPIDLEGAGADLAVGCTYKYLNGGPGAPAFLYVRTEHQGELLPPIWGWFGRRDQFAMEQGWLPADGIAPFLSGTPPILSLAAVEVGAAMIAVDAGMDRVRAKGRALTQFAVELFDAWLEPEGFALASPRDSARRGSHVLFRHPDARALYRRLLELGVIPDYREPQGIRMGLAPLTTRFTDVVSGVLTLAGLAARPGS
jgi:kynureninase